MLAASAGRMEGRKMRKRRVWTGMKERHEDESGEEKRDRTRRNEEEGEDEGERGRWKSRKDKRGDDVKSG